MIALPHPDIPGERIVVPLRTAIAIAGCGQLSPDEIHERAVAKRRRHYLRHREEILARQRAYREVNLDKERARCRAYYAAHREEINARTISRRSAARQAAADRREASA